MLAARGLTGEPGPGSRKEPGAPAPLQGRMRPPERLFDLCIPVLTARDAHGSVTSVRCEETSLMLPGFPFLPILVVAFGKENKQSK